MTQSHQSLTLENGIAVIHANKLENLIGVVQEWLSKYPLPPLENEVFLVNNNGMGQWLKQQLARNEALGVAAGIDIKLPSTFIWQVYRTVLGNQIPKEQPLAKSALIWRIYRLLPTLITLSHFQSLAQFLVNDTNSRKRYQLSLQLADLFDQYQVYRSDWLADWAKGLDSLRDAHGILQILPETQYWQPLLWREILKDLGDFDSVFASRASVHAEFISKVDETVPKLPKRIIVFGLSTLPQQSLEVLAKLGKFCQVILFVHNPCQYYWADIIEDKDLLKSDRRRHAYKAKIPSEINIDELHQHANPLLAAWGKQGRDYIRLLDFFDDQSVYKHWDWPGLDNKIDIFQDYGTLGQQNLLQKLQQSILDLEPIPANPIFFPKNDQSLAFHIAHSPQREVEILHDQLLARFNTADQLAEPLHPRDVIIMVPDINTYAPHIRAVFGQIKKDDNRYIPFSLADQQQRGQNPLLGALEALLKLSESRFAVSECLGLLEVPALRKRFAIEESALPKLHQWIEESGIRWGLNSQQRRHAVDMPDNLIANTWQFGLQRMLLGYAVGAGQTFKSIEPYAEIGGLESQWLGNLAWLQELLESYVEQLSQDHTVEQWHTLLLALLDDFFLATNDSERKTLDELKQSLKQWQQFCQQAKLNNANQLPINVVREAWLTAFDEPNLQQRFLSGRVNFCTLMPMRAIPFQLVCLLGMNDGDYPRNYHAQSFDLMAQRGFYRPGDRSRRQDDQYLFMEALLSAREQLYISWVGRSIRDNSERPPSVLVSQLRDFLDQTWQVEGASDKLLDSITLEHPLQAFSSEYIKINRDHRLFTYSNEWFDQSASGCEVGGALRTMVDLPKEIAMDVLARFLKAPVKTFCMTSLKLSFSDDNPTSEDNEPFLFNGLQHYQYCNDLLVALQENPAESMDIIFQQQFQRMAAKGSLPLAGFAKMAFNDLSSVVESAWNQYLTLNKAWPIELETLPIIFDVTVCNEAIIQLTGNLPNLRKNINDEQCLLIVTCQSLCKDNKISYHRLMSYWVKHLFGCASGLQIRSIIVGSNAVLQIESISIVDATAILVELANALCRGLQEPLPVAIKTAFVWLSKGDSSAAKKEYEGDEWNNGEVDYDPYLTRFLPNFYHLQAQHNKEDVGFEYWAELLYKKAFEHIKFYEEVHE
jgi:exodeoxyribonuclease V gamma subunit